MDSNNSQEFPEEIFTDAIEKLKEHSKFTGKPFYRFFKDYKFTKNRVGIKDSSYFEHIDKISKQDIIIFSPDKDKLDKIEKINKKVIFPFDKIFLEYPIIEFVVRDNKTILQFTDGFLIDTIKKDDGNVGGILFISIWLDYGQNPNNLAEEGVTTRIILLPYSQLTGEIMFTKELSDEEKNMVSKVTEVLKKVCYLIQKKEYKEYYKWSPSGIKSKEITFYQEVKSHKRHFWKDSGKFIIPTLSKEEILNRGYFIDELVFRGYELRRDVPYQIIGAYKIGEEKPNNINKNNRIIYLLKNRILKKEEELGRIIYQLFPNQFIKKHDRKAVKPLELDFYIRDLKLAFEYDGEQHFDKKICEEVFFSNFDELQKRDRKKEVMCKNNNIKLIRIKYDEPLGINLIKRKLKDKQIKQEDKGELQIEV